MFEIKLNKNIEIHDFYEEEGYFGYITIDNFHERFFSPIEFWSREEYLKNWYQELNKLLNGFPCAKLITRMYNPEYSNFIQAWVLYRIDDKIFIHEQIFFLDEWAKPFLLEELYSKELNRETHSEDGEKISQWEINISDIKKYLAQMNKTDK